MRFKALFTQLMESKKKKSSERSGDSSGGWTIVNTKQFKKGAKKYRNNPRVAEALKELLAFIMQQSSKPMISEYPQKFYVHQIKQNLPYAGPNKLWAHLQGQRIGVVFDVDYGNRVITLYLLGLHSDAKLGK